MLILLIKRCAVPIVDSALVCPEVNFWKIFGEKAPKHIKIGTKTAWSIFEKIEIYCKKSLFFLSDTL